MQDIISKFYRAKPEITDQNALTHVGAGHICYKYDLTLNNYLSFAFILAQIRNTAECPNKKLIALFSEGIYDPNRGDSSLNERIKYFKQAFNYMKEVPEYVKAAGNLPCEQIMPTILAHLSSYLKIIKTERTSNHFDELQIGDMENSKSLMKAVCEAMGINEEGNIDPLFEFICEVGKPNEFDMKVNGQTIKVTKDSKFENFPQNLLGKVLHKCLAKGFENTLIDPINILNTTLLEMNNMLTFDEDTVSSLALISDKSALKGLYENSKFFMQIWSDFHKNLLKEYADHFTDEGELKTDYQLSIFELMLFARGRASKDDYKNHKDNKRTPLGLLLRELNAIAPFDTTTLNDVEKINFSRLIQKYPGPQLSGLMPKEELCKNDKLQSMLKLYWILVCTNFKDLDSTEIDNAQEKIATDMRMSVKDLDRLTERKS